MDEPEDDDFSILDAGRRASSEGGEITPESLDKAALDMSRELAEQELLAAEQANIIEASEQEVSSDDEGKAS